MYRAPVRVRLGAAQFALIFCATDATLEIRSAACAKSNPEHPQFDTVQSRLAALPLGSHGF
jgi:hypothetical protein